MRPTALLFLLVAVGTVAAKTVFSVCNTCILSYQLHWQWYSNTLFIGPLCQWRRSRSRRRSPRSYFQLSKCSPFGLQRDSRRHMLYLKAITDLTSNNIICNTNFIQPVSTAVIPVNAGDKLTAQFHRTSAGYLGPDPSDPIDPTNKGPILAYLWVNSTISHILPNRTLLSGQRFHPPPNPQLPVCYWRHKPIITRSNLVIGLKWFKIGQIGYNATNGQWGSDVLFINGGNATFTVPSCIVSGQYLFRAEAIGRKHLNIFSHPRDPKGALILQHCNLLLRTPELNFMWVFKPNLCVPQAATYLIHFLR